MFSGEYQNHVVVVTVALPLSVLPRQTIFYDIVDYLYNHKMSHQLQEELPSLLSRPFSEDVQLQHIRIISQLR